MKRELTGRQREFLQTTLELYHQRGEPLHYASVAKALGVSNPTAYDMLRTLEKRGWLKSVYLLPSRREGAGRSLVLFAPTPQAEASFTPSSEDKLPDEWKPIESWLLSILRRGTKDDFAELGQKLSQALSHYQSPLFFAGLMTTALLATLKVATRDGGEKLSVLLRHIGFPNEASLYALAGMVVGLSLNKPPGPCLGQGLLQGLKKYQQALTLLGEEGKRLLILLTDKALRILDHYEVSQAS
ncbi:MAG: helix-turn-helix domain-containing protein [Anaerolineae bacterium]|nr:helix-turn-helix domain-containing protein [Anaerolineae bacterium]